MRSTTSLRQVDAAINGGFKNGPAERALRRVVPWTMLARTTADTTYNNTASLAAISELTVDVEDGRAYEFFFYSGLSIAAAANNIQFAFDGGTATAALIEGYYQFFDNGATAAQQYGRISALNTAISGSTSTAWEACMARGILVVTAGGKLIVRGAQAAAAATASTARAGTYLRLVEVG